MNSSELQRNIVRLKNLNSRDFAIAFSECTQKLDSLIEGKEETFVRLLESIPEEFFDSLDTNDPQDIEAIHEYCESIISLLEKKYFQGDIETPLSDLQYSKVMDAVKKSFEFGFKDSVSALIVDELLLDLGKDAVIDENADAQNRNNQNEQSNYISAKFKMYKHTKEFIHEELKNPEKLKMLIEILKNNNDRFRIDDDLCITLFNSDEVSGKDWLKIFGNIAINRGLERRIYGTDFKANIIEKMSDSIENPRDFHNAIRTFGKIFGKRENFFDQQTINSMIDFYFSIKNNLISAPNANSRYLFYSCYSQIKSRVNEFPSSIRFQFLGMLVDYEKTIADFCPYECINEINFNMNQVTQVKTANIKDIDLLVKCINSLETRGMNIPTLNLDLNSYRELSQRTDLTCGLNVTLSLTPGDRITAGDVIPSYRTDMSFAMPKQFNIESVHYDRAAPKRKTTNKHFVCCQVSDITIPGSYYYDIARTTYHDSQYNPEITYQVFEKFFLENPQDYIIGVAANNGISGVFNQNNLGTAMPYIKTYLELENFMRGFEYLRQNEIFYGNLDVAITPEEYRKFQMLRRIPEDLNLHITCQSIGDLSVDELERMLQIKEYNTNAMNANIPQFSLYHATVADITLFDKGLNNAQSTPYNLADFVRCRRILENYFKDVKIPDFDDKSREKMIFQQVVKILAEHISYDYDVVNRTNEYNAQIKMFSDKVASLSTLPQIEENKKAIADAQNEIARLSAERDRIDQVTCRNMIGGLRDGRSVCAGYAEILRNSLSLFGIEAKYISKFKKEPEKDTGLCDGHAWNQVRLDGEWFNVDLTWAREEILRNPETIKYLLVDDKSFYEGGLVHNGQVVSRNIISKAIEKYSGYSLTRGDINEQPHNVFSELYSQSIPDEHSCSRRVTLDEWLKIMESIEQCKDYETLSSLVEISYLQGKVARASAQNEYNVASSINSRYSSHRIDYPTNSTEKAGTDTTMIKDGDTIVKHNIDSEYKLSDVKKALEKEQLKKKAIRLAQIKDRLNNIDKDGRE